MDIKLLKQMIHEVETDEEVKATKFLTDGDEAEFPQALGILVNYLNDTFVGKKEAAELEQHGLQILYGDCICIVTKKGIVNTGSDNV
jgi:hypothetical protein